MNTTITTNTRTLRKSAGKTVPAGAMLDAAPQGTNMLIPLSELHVSKDNVRTTPTGDVGELAALIRAEGLLQRLAIVKEQGGFGVVAGGRRLRAMQLLVADGSWPAAQPVECRLFDTEHGARLSLVENSGREAIHPADQMGAFKRLIDTEGLTVEQVAGRFGVSVLTVQRRLKLAALAPRFLALYRAAEISHDQLIALTLCDGHEAQCAIWDGLSEYSRSAYSIRSMVERGGCEARDRVAVFVGLEAYRQAGGTLREDLFTDDGNASVFLQDGSLLSQLAMEKLEATGRTLVQAEGWSWISYSLDANGPYVDSLRNYGREKAGQREPTEREAMTFAALDKTTMDATAAANAYCDNNDEDAEGYCEAVARLTDAAEAADEAASDAREVLRCWASEQVQRCGAMVYVAYSSPSWTAFQRDRGRHFRLIVDAVAARSWTMGVVRK